MAAVAAAPAAFRGRVWAVMSRGWTAAGGHGPQETRSKSQIHTPFPHRFPLNSHALTSVEGLLGQDGIDAAIQTTSTSKAGRVDFGGCGPPATMNDEGLVDAAAARPLPRFKGPYGDQANRQVTTRIGFPLQRSLIRITPWGALAPPV